MVILGLTSFDQIFKRCGKWLMRTCGALRLYQDHLYSLYSLEVGTMIRF